MREMTHPKHLETTPKAAEELNSAWRPIYLSEITECRMILLGPPPIRPCPLRQYPGTASEALPQAFHAAETPNPFEHGQSVFDPVGQLWI